MFCGWILRNNLVNIKSKNVYYTIFTPTINFIFFLLNCYMRYSMLSLQVHVFQNKFFIIICFSLSRISFSVNFIFVIIFVNCNLVVWLIDGFVFFFLYVFRINARLYVNKSGSIIYNITCYMSGKSLIVTKYKSIWEFVLALAMAELSLSLAFCWANYE